MQTAIGFRTHSGWAAVVAIGRSPQGPVVCDRRTIILADPEIRGSKQPYHSAEPLPTAKAKEFLKRCTDSTFKLAVASLTTMLAELKQNGHVTVGGMMIGASGRMLGSVEEILSSHPAIHTAEGEFYRDAVTHACGHCKLAIGMIRQKEILEVAQTALGFTQDKIEEQIIALGKTVGSPWTQDQKLAALAAWIAVVTAPVKRQKNAASA